MAEPSFESVLDAQLVPNTLVACGTLLVYDWLCTLDKEVSYVWTSPWSIGSSLFFLNRYLPFVDTFLSLNLKLSINTPETCLRHFTIVTWFIVAGIIISEVVLVLRTLAIWQSKKFIFIILCTSCAVTFIPSIVITNLELRSLRYSPSVFPGCQLATASSIIIVAYILLALSETVMAVLTGIKAYRDFRNSRVPWIKQLFREGLLFYVYLLSISITNILVPILAPRIFANWLATPQRVMHSVLCNRVLFLILKQRSANLTNRLRRQVEGSSQEPEFTSFFDDIVSPNLTIAYPSTSGQAVSASDGSVSSNRDGIEMQPVSRTRLRDIP